MRIEEILKKHYNCPRLVDFVSTVPRDNSYVKHVALFGIWVADYNWAVGVEEWAIGLGFEPVLTQFAFTVEENELIINGVDIPFHAKTKALGNLTKLDGLTVSVAEMQRDALMHSEGKNLNNVCYFLALEIFGDLFWD